MGESRQVTGEVLDVLHGTRQTIGIGCSRAWRLCSFSMITDKQTELWLQAGPGYFSLSYKWFMISTLLQNFLDARVLECSEIYPDDQNRRSWSKTNQQQGANPV